MKKILFLLSMVLATYTVALTLTSCSGEDDRKEEKQTPNTPTKEDPKNNDGPTANELTVMTNCTPCNGGGKCPTCKGSGKGCKTCNGTGKHCDTCGGTGKHCDKCGGTGKFCSSCGGTGICSSCDDGNCEDCYGSGKVDCSWCEGYYGNCPTCKGLGKRYYGGKEYTCTTCSGSGRCRYCNGKGTEKCSMCNGTGKCRYCGGTRKCSTCDGNPKCPICNGNPVCKSCNGTASCKSCGGDGHCADCANSDGKCKTCSGTGEVTLSSVTFSNEGGSERFQIRCDGSWNASTAADWIKLSSPSGSGNSSFTIIADANKTTSTRSDKVTFSYSGKSLSITVTQSGEPLALSVSPNSINFSEGGGNQSVTITSNTDWTASNSAEWLHLSAESGSGNGTLTITADENSSHDARNTTVQLKYGTKTVSLKVSQDGVPYKFNVSNTTVEFTDQGGENTLTITSNTNWKASMEGGSWIKISAYSGSGNSNFTITADENFTTESRKATIKFTYNNKTVTVNVNQAGKKPVEMKLKDMLSKVMGTISVDFKNESLASIKSKAEKSYEITNYSDRFAIYDIDNDNCKNLVYHGVPFRSFSIDDDESYRYIYYSFKIEKSKMSSSTSESVVVLILQDFRTEMGVSLENASDKYYRYYRYYGDKISYHVLKREESTSWHFYISMYLYH